MSGERSRIWEAVRAGEKLTGELIIDCHTHMGPWKDFHIPRPWAEGMVFAMDTCGIDLAASAPHAGIGPAEELGNEQIRQAVEDYPTRFLGYCSLNPHRSEAAIRGELEKHVLRGNLKAIKLHPSIHAYPVTGERYRPVWEFANEHSVPVLIHTWEGDARCRPSLFADLGKQYPNVDMLLGHSGGTAGGMDESIEVAQKWERLYLDLTGSLLPRGMLERMVDEVGADRVLFGTDMPFVDGRPQIGYVACARISDDDKRSIFGLNAKRIFGL